jgi:integrase
MSSKSSENSAEKLTVLDGKLHIYKRPRSSFWQCGFHHNGHYLRSSTKLEDLSAATEKAKQWYYEKQVEIRMGAPVAPHNITFAYFAELAIKDYERLAEQGRGSKKYATSLKTLLNNDLIKFFGKYPLASINQQLWNRYLHQRLIKSDGNEDAAEKSKKPAKSAKPSTIHHHLNGIRVVFRRAKMRGDISSTPEFVTERKTAADATPRTWFEPDQYELLYNKTRANIWEKKGTRWHDHAKELHDFVLFVANTGLRIGEARNVRFCDVKYGEDINALGEKKPILIISNIKGKRGTGSCKSYFGAVRPFERLLKRSGLNEGEWKQSTKLLFQHYHRDMFNAVLKAINLKETADRPPRKRDLMSLRHTYICMRLLNGVGVYEIANNCRTSVSMIENHYARWLSNVQSDVNKTKLKKFGNEEENEIKQ